VRVVWHADGTKRIGHRCCREQPMTARARAMKSSSGRGRAGRLLVLEPPYKSTWDIPGGVIESDESPRLAAQREVREELGLSVEPGDLLAVDWQSRSGDVTEMVAFLFDGGVLAPADIDQMVIEPTEAKCFRFVSLNEAERLLDAELFARVAAGLKAQRSTATVYLENGFPPPSTPDPQR
jgi:8-oxo-dGTP pyrophosphatase MutT (NUDIX family)